LIASCDTIRIGEQFNSILCFSICFYHKHTVSNKASKYSNYIFRVRVPDCKKGVIKASPYGTVNLLLSLLGSLKKNFCKKKNWCWCQILLIKFFNTSSFFTCRLTCACFTFNCRANLYVHNFVKGFKLTQTRNF
jgi:hypothetical protein